MTHRIIVVAPNRKRLVRVLRNNTTNRHLALISQLQPEFPHHQFFWARVDKSTPPPPSFVPPRDRKGLLWWCPYCCCERHFRTNRYLGVRQCNVCRVSDNDMDVRVMNCIPEPKEKVRIPKRSLPKPTGLEKIESMVVDPKKHRAAMRKARREKRKNAAKA